MRIIKIGGRAQSDRTFVTEVAAAWRESPGKLCIVHGGGDEISGMQKRLGLEPKMSNGRRITTADDLEVVRMVLSGLTNKRLVSAFMRQGITAVGISGEDGGLLCADPRDAQEYGMVGMTPDVKPDVLFQLLDAGLLPIVSPVSTCSDAALSEALNVNGDDAAAAIAVAMHADELLFISDVEGVRESSGATVAHLDCDQARGLIESGTAEGGMRAKLESAMSALDSGVARVRIGSVEMLRDIDAGTLIRSATGVAS